MGVLRVQLSYRDQGKAAIPVFGLRFRPGFRCLFRERPFACSEIDQFFGGFGFGPAPDEAGLFFRSEFLPLRAEHPHHQSVGSISAKSFFVSALKGEIGEVRGIEARTLVDAMNTGHRGTLSTVHVSSPQGAIRRIAVLASRGSQQLTLAEAEEETRAYVDSRGPTSSSVTRVSFGSQEIAVTQEGFGVPPVALWRYPPPVLTTTSISCWEVLKKSRFSRSELSGTSRPRFTCMHSRLAGHQFASQPER